MSDDDYTQMQARLAALERKAGRASAFKRSMIAICKVMGWIIIIPSTVLAAIAGIMVTITAVAALLGAVAWRTPLQWVIATVVLAVLRVIGAVFASIGSPDRE